MRSGKYQIEQLIIWKTLLIFFGWMGLAFIIAYQSYAIDSGLLGYLALALSFGYFIVLSLPKTFLTPYRKSTWEVSERGIEINKRRHIEWRYIKELQIQNLWQTLQINLTLVINGGRNISLTGTKSESSGKSADQSFYRLRRDLEYNLRQHNKPIINL